MKILSGGVTLAKGYKSLGVHCGLRKNTSKKDLAVIVSEVDAVYAAAFTKNAVKAAPVIWDQEVCQASKKIKCIVVNSANANACTGPKGYEDVKLTAKTAAKLFATDEKKVMVSSTGVIGVSLPVEKIVKGLEENHDKLDSTVKAGLDAAEAIMTTDTFSKEFAVEIEIGGKTAVIGGMAKGSGMIHPNMGTMLSYITTDVSIDKDLLEKAMLESVEDSYNMISVDGDTSTNDSVIVMANGLCGNPIIDDEDSNDYQTFKEALHFVNEKLAKTIVKDGEGASKFIKVKVSGAKTKDCARVLAKSVITSSLVKTAFFGEDANWGRIICALGYSGVHFDQGKVAISFTSGGGQIYLMKEGTPLEFDEELAKKVLEENCIEISIKMKEGFESATGYGCDLSYDYVKINGDYRS